MTPPNSASPEPDQTRRRLLYRANHRGTHETDLMVGGFVTARLASFTDEDIAALEVILEYPDVDLADWLSGRRPIPEEFDSPMLQTMYRAVHP